jgi:hypothetical protein
MYYLCYLCGAKQARLALVALNETARSKLTVRILLGARGRE